MYSPLQAAESGLAGNGATHGQESLVIAGGGIIGTATAYYLSRLGIAATVVEKGEVACASSGKAGEYCFWPGPVSSWPLSWHCMPQQGGYPAADYCACRPCHQGSLSMHVALGLQGSMGCHRRLLGNGLV